MPHTPNCSSLPNPPLGDFAPLVARICDGDERALEQMLISLAAPLRRIAESYIGNSLQPHVDADDLVQPVTLILWNGLRTGKLTVATPQQLMGLARLLLKRQAAKAAQHFKPTIDAMAATVERDLGATLGDRRIMPVSCPANKAEVNEQIQQLMTRVSKDDRRMLELLLTGHSVAAAARTLKIEPAALRMRLSRLRIRVRKVRHIRVTVRKTRREDQAAGPKPGIQPVSF